MLCFWVTISSNIPDTELLYKWGIPYVYYKKKPFVYLAPNHKKGFVDVGFAKGVSAYGKFGQIDGRKQEYGKIASVFFIGRNRK